MLASSNPDGVLLPHASSFAEQMMLLCSRCSSRMVRGTYCVCFFQLLGRASVYPSLETSMPPRSIRPSVCPSICPSLRLSIHPSVCPSIRLSVHLSICPSVHLSICPSVYPFHHSIHHHQITTHPSIIIKSPPIHPSSTSIYLFRPSIYLTVPSIHPSVCP
jgi:hypothetical protein